MATDPVAVEPAVIEMIGNRIIDNAAVTAASLARPPVANARRQAVAHPFQPGATVFGLPQQQRVSPEWAAWANGVAVRELDFHDTYLAADYSHPGDNIPPILAVAQHCGLDGAALVRACAKVLPVSAMGAVGIECTSDEQCRSGLCVEASPTKRACTDVCCTDADCADPAFACRPNVECSAWVLRCDRK